ncbi:MAG: hypothetical protein RMJ39_05100 [Deltaproteobacteria bacterium]|nr:hypothetical protein [Deltaproteobacteria bacterium]
MRTFSILIFFVLIILSFSFTCHASFSLFVEKGIEELKKENYEEALQYFLEARKLDPHSSIVAYYAGITCKHMEDYECAITHLRDAVTLKPSVIEALPELIDALNVTENLAEAKRFIELAEKERIAQPKVAYLKGLVLMKEKNYKGAILEFEKAKSLDPNLSQACEFQIGIALAREGKLKEAVERFKSTITLDPTTDIATYAKDYERILKERIERERPLRLSFSLNYKYDSNVVTKGEGPIVEQISGHQGSAMNLSFRASYTFPFSFRKPVSLSLSYGLLAEKYFSKRYTRADGTKGNLKEYTNMTNSFTLFSGFSRERWAVSLPIFYNYYSLQGVKSNSFFDELSWWNTARYMEQYGTTPTFRFLLRSNIIGEISCGFSKRHYFKTLLHPRPLVDEELRDADILSTSFGLTTTWKEGRSVIALRYTFGKEHAKGRNWSVDREDRISISLLYPLDGITKLPIKLQVTGDASFQKYKYVHTFFDKKRRDDVYNFTGAIIYELMRNLDIIGQYTYVRDKCNIEIYNYKREIMTLGFEYKF